MDVEVVTEFLEENEGLDGVPVQNGCNVIAECGGNGGLYDLSGQDDDVNVAMDDMNIVVSIRMSKDEFWKPREELGEQVPTFLFIIFKWDPWSH